MMKKILITIFFIIYCNRIFSQNIIVTGLITDKNKTPIENVSVSSQSEDIKVETKTNVNGEFTIILPDTVNVLHFSKAGYNNFETRVNSNANLTITLELSDLLIMSLEELLKTNVNTVTLKEEKLKDAPGIVTIFTGEELRNMGIRNVKEALILVPGFSLLQNDDEQIIASRGIFATSSQKILFMRNGHSLNEGNLDIPQMEYSIAMESIKKIEIIRGPGASIYGNSAFAAVVNIITEDQEGVMIKAGIGNYGQFNYDSYICKNISSDSYFLFFGRYTNIKGEPFDVNLDIGDPDGIINGTMYASNYPQNYDVGYVYKNKKYSTSLSIRRHCYQTYWTTNGQYTNVDSLFWQPRLLQNSVHYDITFNLKLKEKNRITLQNYTDYSVLTNSRLTGNITAEKYTRGLIQINEWNVLKAGLNYYSTIEYNSKGTLVAGIAIEHRRYLDSWLMSNAADSSVVALSEKPFYPESNESRGAGFVQAQQSITDWFKLDIGARYDMAQKFDATFNPRLALIFYPINRFSMKLIYTKAFQAPGYSYRNSNADYSGSIETLQPEIISMYQWSARYDFKKTSFVEISAFYNQLDNLITRIDGNYYSNYGKMASYGIEAESRISIYDFTVFGNYAMLLPDTSFMDEKFLDANIHNNKFKNMPEHTSNIGFTYAFKNTLDFTFYNQFTSSFFSVNDELIDDKFLFNAVIRIKDIYKTGEINLTVHNITNKKYYLGDPSVSPLPQTGRWYLVSCVLNF